MVTEDDLNRQGRQGVAKDAKPEDGFTAEDAEIAETGRG